MSFAWEVFSNESERAALLPKKGERKRDEEKMTNSVVTWAAQREPEFLYSRTSMLPNKITWRLGKYDRGNEITNNAIKHHKTTKMPHPKSGKLDTDR
jgi:hypothetical protein